MNQFELAKKCFLDGCIFLEAQDFSRAECSFIKSLELMPDRASTLTNLSATQFKLKKYAQAQITAKKAILIEHANAAAYLNLGLIDNELKKYKSAIDFFNIALSLNSDYHEVWNNKAVSLHELKRYEDAISHFDKALTLKPDYHEAWTNKGVSLHRLKRYEDAISHFDKALTLKPDYHEASLSKGLCLLSKGDFESGLPLYESRWYSEKFSEAAGRRFFEKPTWLGVESLRDKTILLYGEQGLGDFIHFCRYTKLVSDLGAKVILEAPESLANLLENLEGVSKLIIKGEELPFFDYQCPLLSLPLALNTNISSIPTDIPYLTANPHKIAEWNLKLGKKSNVRVGVVWSSMSNFHEDSTRSLKLIDFVKALPLEGFEYICLQKELKDCDKEFFQAYKNIRFFGDQLNDFSDTAALIECLDIVISSCTSIPHLSAALGKDTRVLLSYVADWRWLIDKEDSPWYPSMKLYRQSIRGDWDSPLLEIKKYLSSLRH